MGGYLSAMLLPTYQLSIKMITFRPSQSYVVTVAIAEFECALSKIASNP